MQLSGRYWALATFFMLCYYTAMFTAMISLGFVLSH